MKTTIIALILLFTSQAQASDACKRLDSYTQHMSRYVGNIFGMAMKRANLTDAQIYKVLAEVAAISEDPKTIASLPAYRLMLQDLSNLGCINK